MLTTTIKGLLARKLRLLTTSLAVLLGVAFMAGTLVLTDTIGKTFDDLFADVNAGTDAFVRSEESVTTDFGGQRARLDAGLVDDVRAVQGVAGAIGTIQGYTQLLDADGEPVGDPVNGAPTFGGNWIDVDALNPFEITSGTAPTADDEVVIDKASADLTGYGPGDRAEVVTIRGLHDVTISGVARFGQVDSPAGATYVLFTSAAAQQLVAEPGRFDAVVAVAADGLGEAALVERIAAVLPDTAEVLTGTEITEEDQSAVAEQLGFFSTFLLTFALVALFVGSFIIYNTFSIVVAQRTREMALLRAIGASRRQVLGSIVLEAVVVGTIASVLGLVSGIGVAIGLKAVLAGFGIDIPAGGIVLLPRTVVLAFLAGLVVSVGSAVLPARRASRVPPIAALRDVAHDGSARSSARVAAGAGISVLGAGALAAGLVGDVGVGSVGLGAVLVFLGVAVLGPVIAGPVSRVLGAPLPRLKGMAGTLARDNAVRNPTRTSATAAALMIGVGLVGFITILASSTKASVEDVLSGTFTGDVVVDSGSFGFGGFPPELAERLGELPEVDAASGIRSTPAVVDGEETSLSSADPTAIERIIDIGVVEGGLAGLDATGIAVLDTAAGASGLSLGDTVPVTFTETGEQELEVRAIYTADELAGTWLVGLPVIEANVADQLDLMVYVTLAEGVAVEDALPAIEAVAAGYPTAEVQDEAAYIEAQSAFIDTLLGLIYVLLGLAVLIALLGITNTLALSVFERTRELGLLRAVGMTRRQLRATIRWESVIIALLGTVLGLTIGLFFGWAMVEALEDDGFTALVVPGGQLAVIALIAALAGVAAAILPARRAARLDVLAAIATD